MIFKNKNFSKIFFYHILFVLPLFQYLNKNNLELFVASDIIYFFLSVLLLQFFIGMFPSWLQLYLHQHFIIQQYVYVCLMENLLKLENPQKYPRLTNTYQNKHL